MHSPEPKRRAPFTAPRKAPIYVQASQQHYSQGEESDLEDGGGYGEHADDVDSLFSQSSSKAPRKKL
jgi:hypothetical protein